MQHKLIAFDVDGTLVKHPNDWTVWEVFNDRFTGNPELNVERYAQYKTGKLSYADWVGLDISGWREASASREDLIEALADLTPINDADQTLQTLKQTIPHLVVISGTLDIVLHHFFKEAPFDEIYCNHIGFDEAGQIAHWRATPFDMRGKATLLETLAIRHGVRLQECVYVGDSDNDQWIFERSGLSIGFNPKTEKIRSLADVVVESESLADILPHLI